MTKRILISLDIDGTLEVGDPPGDLTMEMVRIAKSKGFIIGTCSDRPLSTQRKILTQHDIEIEFAVSKHMLPDVKEYYNSELYNGDTKKKYRGNGYSFIKSKRQ